MSKFDRNRIKDGWEKLCTNKQTDKPTDRQTNRHYENNGHLAVNQQCGRSLSDISGLLSASEINDINDRLCGNLSGIIDLVTASMQPLDQSSGSVNQSVVPVRSVPEQSVGWTGGLEQTVRKNASNGKADSRKWLENRISAKTERRWILQFI